METWTSRLAPQAWPAHWPIPAPCCPRQEWVEPACALFPELAPALAATPQDPVHHAEGDVWTHTQMVVDTLLADSAYARLDPARRGVVFTAALLHDIAKPATTREEGGRVIAPGHSPRGAIDARVALWEHGVPFALREQVCRLIEAHQIPFFAFDNRRGLPAEFTARQMSCDRSVELLCMLAAADMRGRVCADQRRVLDDIELFGEVARELACWDAPYAFPDPATRIAYLASQGARYADEPIYQQEPFEVLMLSGLPASGKSHWAATQSHLPQVSYDQLREELGLKAGQGVGTVVHAADDRMREFLRKRQPFIANATHLSRQMRQRTLELIRAYGGAVRIVYFEVPKAQLMARNAARDSSLPNAKILAMAHRWEVPGLDEAEHVDVHLASGPKARPSP